LLLELSVKAPLAGCLKDDSMHNVHKDPGVLLKALPWDDLRVVRLLAQEE
jgi:hypothetical protein